MSVETQHIPVPATALDRAVAGLNLMPGTLRDQLGTEPRLLVFLRHFGCMFCRETLADLRDAAERDVGFPRPLFFYQGTVSEGRALLGRVWPAAQAIADPEADLYRAFGIERGGLLKMFGPEVFRARSRAREKGHRNGERGVDIWRMPGVMLAHGEEIVWAHAFQHAGDQPDYAMIGEIAARVAA